MPDQMALAIDRLRFIADTDKVAFVMVPKVDLQMLLDHLDELKASGETVQGGGDDLAEVVEALRPFAAICGDDNEGTWETMIADQVFSQADVRHAARVVAKHETR